MTETSFPVVDKALSDHQWQTIAEGIGWGVIDHGDSPYLLTGKDSITNEVTISVGNVTGVAEALLRGFAHQIDADARVSVPAVSSTTNYEIGLVYDPLKHAAEGGPVSLTSWVTPADNSGGRSRMVLYKCTRTANDSLGTVSFTQVRPRQGSVIGVAKASDLPSQGVRVDTLALVRDDKTFRRARIDDGVTVTWEVFGGSGSNADIEDATHLNEPGKLVRRWSGNGTFHAPTPSADVDVANKGYVDSKATWSQISSKPSTFPPSGHTHAGTDIRSSIPYDVINGSETAYNNTNVGSTWASVVATSVGRFGRYPSALKYKKNVRSWSVTPETIYGLTPVKYEDTQNGDTRVGFVADSYINTLPEMVETNPDTGEVEGWRYMLTCVAQQVAIRDLHKRLKAKEHEAEILAFNQQEILAYLGLNTDAEGRVITTDGAA